MTLTTDVNKVLKALQQLEPKGHINLISGLRIAHVSANRSRIGNRQRSRVVGLDNVLYVVISHS